MGFCRRCGDIVNGQRCGKCGGSVVAPAVSWNQTVSQEGQDKWSKTYVSRERSTSPVRPKSRAEGAPNPSIALTSSAKPFPRTIGPHITGSTPLDNRITDHIASVSVQVGLPPPLKPTVTGPKPESGILPSLVPNDTTLSKVYGSVLQPKESLATHSCATCAVPFLPDATIYPDPSLSAPDELRFLCRQCFIISGGSKGLCPTCSKAVTILKAEGGFVYAADKYWHKRCFNCQGCTKNIGNSPMIDLLGRPSCAECFDTCLSHEHHTPKRATPKPNKSNPPTEWWNPGGYDLSSNTPNKFREASPAIEELEQRLGIASSREGSPAIEELSQRLSSIGKDYHLRYVSPTSPPQARSSRLNGSPSPVRRLERFKSSEPEDQLDTGSSVLGSPRQATSSPAPTTDAIEEMKKRFLGNSTASPTTSIITLLESSPKMSVSPLRPSDSSMSLRNNSTSKIPVPVPRAEPLSPSSSTPDLMSDISDTLTQSSFSGVDSPPRITEPLFSQPQQYGRTDLLSNPDEIIIEETKSQLNTPNQTPQSTIKLRSNTIATMNISAKPVIIAAAPEQTTCNVPTTTACAKCDKSLFALKEGGKFVTVPGDKAMNTSQTFHRECFRCTFCDDIFSENGSGQTMFVKSNSGPAHVECAPPEKIVIRKSPSASSLRFSHEKALFKNSYSPSKSPSPSPQKSNTNYSSSRFERPLSTATAIATSFPRFGSRSACPGCSKSVSPMERGVVPGPQGSRWHADCLVCGGKRPSSKSTSWMTGKGEEKKEPGCGKKLDSAAKADTNGRIWCRQCLLMLGVGGSPQASPARVSLTSTSGNKVTPQLPGSTTIAHQFTGVGGSDAGLLRQLTGGLVSPTRSLSPTKQLSYTGSGKRPRPKSVIGVRSSKSIDEGRGMFLVRQFTGAGSPNHWGEV